MALATETTATGTTATETTAAGTTAAGTTATPSSGRARGPFDAGALVRSANGSLAALARGLDPACLCGGDAVTLYDLLCAGQRHVVATKALLAARIEESGAFRHAGFASAAAHLASLEGTTGAETARTVRTGHQLSSLPGVEEAARDGKLSGPKLAEVAGVATDHPEAEDELLSGIEDHSLDEVRTKGRRIRDRHPEADQRAKVAAIHQNRHLIWGTTKDGAFWYRGEDTATRGAVLAAAFEAATKAQALAEEGNLAEGEARTPWRALQADALYALVTGGGSAGSSTGAGATTTTGTGTGTTGTGTGTTDPTTTTGTPTPDPADQPHSDRPHSDRPHSDRPHSDRPHSDRPRAPRPSTPPATLLVRVDLDVLLGATAREGSVCELDGMGPLPPVTARDLADAALLRLVFHRAGDIRAVAHLGRTIPALLRTALEARDPTCAVPHCSATRNLEIHHLVDFAQGGPTCLDNLVRLCARHHHLLTYEGWTLTRTNPEADEAPRWSFTPQPAFGEEPEGWIEGDRSQEQLELLHARLASHGWDGTDPTPAGRPDDEGEGPRRE